MSRGIFWFRRDLRLADNPALRQRMGATGRQQVLERHTWPASAEKLCGLYESILRKRIVLETPID